MKQKENKATTRKKIKKSHLILIFAASAAVLTAAAVTISQKIYYGSRWYKNTNVNGVDISGQTLKESEENLNKMYQDYSLTMTSHTIQTPCGRSSRSQSWSAEARNTALPSRFLPRWNTPPGKSNISAIQKHRETPLTAASCPAR